MARLVIWHAIVPIMTSSQCLHFFAAGFDQAQVDSVENDQYYKTSTRVILQLPKCHNWDPDKYGWIERINRQKNSF